MVLVAVLLLSALWGRCEAEPEVEIANDLLNGVSGRRGEMVCRISGGDRPSYCLWESPQGRRFYSDEEGKGGIGVEMRERKRDEFECVLTVERLNEAHGGNWECRAGGQNAGRFGFVRVDQTDRAGIVARTAQTEKLVDQGSDVTLVCPSSNGKKPYCRWYGPHTTKPLVLIDRYGFWDPAYNNDGVELFGNPEKGECGIRITGTQRKHFGQWRCVLLQKSTTGPGSVATEKAFAVTASGGGGSTGGLSQQGRIYGYVRGARNADISMKVADDADADLYWIVQRRHVVREGARVCPENGYCYEASTRSNGRSTLTVDELSGEDVKYPVALVEQHKRGGEDVFKVELVPKSRPDDDPGFRTEKSTKEGNDVTKLLGRELDQCLIMGKIYDKGELAELRRYCVLVECVSNGGVELYDLNTPECRTTRGERSSSTTESSAGWESSGFERK